MRRLRVLVALLSALAAFTALAAPPEVGWSPVDAFVRAQVAAGALPGAVVMVGDREGIWHATAVGDRTRQPRPEPMTLDTIFDLASLTKVIATTTAVLQLVERGKLALDVPAARYWPAFAAHGKSAITVRQLLTHTSGLRAGLDLRGLPGGPHPVLRQLLAQQPIAAPGTAVLYSDLNFIVLGEIVQRVAGVSLDRYCERHIFRPLGMRDTGFRPGLRTLSRVAPTGVFADGRPRRGPVHDPTAMRLGGVAGHAGLFGTAADLARYAQALLAGGAAGKARILRPDSVAALARVATPGEHSEGRGLGWTLVPPLVANRESLPSRGAIGHTGYTGTGVWIDFVEQRFVIILSNRVHPDGRGDARPLRREILGLVAALAPPLSATQLATRLGLQSPMQPAMQPPMQSSMQSATPLAAPAATQGTTHEPAVPTAAPGPGQGSPARPSFATGIDVLAAQGFAPLAGKRVGLVTNLTGVDARGRRTIDLLRWAPGVTLALIFTPEHGLHADAEGPVGSQVEPLSRIPVASLYGATKRPAPSALAGLDAIVFDLQDAGARFYTYVATLGYVLEAAAQARIPVFVLDRPNPIRADRIDGPMLDADLVSFTAYLPMPVQHGMTLGELARMIVAERHLDADLHVVAMQGYHRAQWYSDTRQDWLPPSPNLRTPRAAALYPGVALVEATRISVGRGTDTPFEWVGAPWLDAARLARELGERAIAGVRFAPEDRIPDAGPYRDQSCHGVRITVVDRNALRAPLLGVELASALWRLHPDRFDVDRLLPMVGSRATVAAIRAGEDPRTIAADWSAGLAAFEQRRAAYLLY